MKFVFTMTAGRTGSGFLAELFRRNVPDAAVVHEHLDWRAFGTRTPDVSHLVRFNNEGFSDHVRQFWARKLSGIVATGVSAYVETSHVLMKAGLIEGLLELEGDHEIHLVAQRRERVPTLVSYHRRFDFVNLGNRYLWYLDPSYRCNLVNPAPFLDYGVHGIRLWYLLEMEARTAWYTGRLADVPNVTVHTTNLAHVTQPDGARGLVRAVMGDERVVSVPSKVNANPTSPLPGGLEGQLEAMVSRISSFDAGALVAPLLAAGTDPFLVRPMATPSSNTDPSLVTPLARPQRG